MITKKIRLNLPLEHCFGFCKSFGKITKNLGFHLTFRAADLQDILYTTLGVAVNYNVTNFIIYLFVPMLISSIETQAMFNESNMNN